MKNLEIFQKKGIEFEQGLSVTEIDKIEQIYEIKFPQELKNMYTELLPISEGFYKWRDFSNLNVEYIKKILEKPFKEIENEIDDVEWCDDWGEEPLENERIRAVEQKLKVAPKLIPIYSHRYVASGKMEQSPVFSVHGADIIYYGENITQYLEIEFAGRPYNEIDYGKIVQVPFWSEIVQG